MAAVLAPQALRTRARPLDGLKPEGCPCGGVDTLALLRVAGVGVLGGVASGLFAIGGGILRVPLLLVAVPGTGFKEAKAASLVVACVSSLVAVLAHRRRGSVDLRTGFSACPACSAPSSPRRTPVWVNATATTVAHLALGYLPALVALGAPLAFGAVPGGEIGARLAHRLPAARLQRAFGGFLVAAGAWLALAS